LSNNEYKDASAWFMHDCNAKDDPKIMLVIDQLGLEGFGIYWTAVETLREQKDYKYPLSLIPSLARKYNTSQVKFETVVKEYGLFEIDENESFFSLSLCRRMSKLDEVKAKKRLGGKRSGETRKKQSEERLRQLSLLNSREDSSNTHATFLKHNRTNITKHNIREEEENIKKIEYSDIESKMDRNMILALIGCETLTQKASINMKIEEFIEYCVAKQKKYTNYNDSFARYMEIARQNGWNF